MAYGTDEGFAQWLLDQGITVPSSPSHEVLRNRGSAYIDATYGARFIGQRAVWDQNDEWPRTGAVMASGVTVPADAIPRQVVLASYRAAVAEAQGVSLSRVYDPVGNAGAVKREKVDVIETEYFSAPTDAASAAPVVAGLDSLLAPFLRPEGARVGFGFMVI